jgi:glycosyltransferase involved in cell wall biosynthesis
MAGPHVAILLCTYNGEAYLREQLDSYLAQTHGHWTLIVSDDGSTDRTLAILESYRTTCGRPIIVREGPRNGFAQNFLSLIRDPMGGYDYYAFSDQDDIWLPDRLQRGLAALTDIAADKPQLYCSRTRLIDGQGNDIGLSPLFQKQPDFRNALVQSIAGANTMLANEATRLLLAQTAVETPIVAHDWLAYLIVTGCGGTVIYDPEPTLLYRQHDGNLIGANAGVRNRVRRVTKMVGGRFRDWNAQNIKVLNGYTPRLTADAARHLHDFAQLRNSGISVRLRLLRRTGLYRQTLAGTLSLYLAVILNRV